MSVKLLTEQCLKLLSLKGEAAQAGLRLHLSKCHIGGNHVSRLKYDVNLQSLSYQIKYKYKYKYKYLYSALNIIQCF